MNRLPLIFAGIFATFAAAWLGLVAYPYVVFGSMQPAPAGTAGELPPRLTALEVRGEQVYAANGCVYCHSQQVRPLPLSTDIKKGLGPRQTVARDYMWQQPAFLGTMRTGPDLSNIGARQPDANWHYRHLFDPRSVTAWSIMPSFRFLYRVEAVSGGRSPDAIDGIDSIYVPAGSQVVPTEDAKALVAYLLSLKKNYPLPESPEPDLE